MEGLKWYHYVAALFAGVFLANAVPHFVNGVSGNPFPTPFSDPPGKGLSAPLTNVLWACINMLIGYILFRGSRLSTKNYVLVILFFIGAIAMSMMLSVHFAEKALM